MTTQTKFSGKYLMVLIAMCGFSACAYGICINSAGVFFTPIAQEFGVGKGAVSMALTISSIVTGVIALFTPKFLKEKSLKPVFFAALVLMCASTVGMAMSSSLVMLYIMNAVRGFGAGLLSFVTITLFINNWFYAKHGLVTSISMGFSGIAGAVLSPIFTSIITASGWRTAYIAAAVLIAVFCLPALIFPITLRPETCGLHAYGIEEKKNTASVAAEEQSKGSTFAFIVLCIASISMNAVIGVVQHLPSYALELGLSAEVGAFMLSLALVGNISSKLIVGSLTDKIGARNALTIIASCNLVSLILLIAGSSIITVYSGSLLLGCSYGIGAVGITLMTKALFGVQGYVRIFPIVSFIGTLSNAAATTGIGYLYDASGSYSSTFMICIVLSVIVIVCILAAFHQSPAETN